MEENNFFGFVSKIGSLIGNNKSIEKKVPKVTQKKYNIKISTDAENEKEIDNIDNLDDMEEEEEEEDEVENEEEKRKEKKKKKLLKKKKIKYKI